MLFIIFISLCLVIIVLLCIIKHIYNENWELHQERKFNLDNKKPLLQIESKSSSSTLLDRTKRYQSNGKGFDNDENNQKKEVL